MAVFHIVCLDKPNSLDLRMATRAVHLEYLNSKTNLLLAGPLLDDNQNPMGSMLLVETETMAEAEDFAANDPYAKAGLFMATKITAYRTVLGSLLK